MYVVVPKQTKPKKDSAFLRRLSAKWNRAGVPFANLPAVLRTEVITGALLVEKAERRRKELRARGLRGAAATKEKHRACKERRVALVYDRRRYAESWKKNGTFNLRRACADVAYHEGVQAHAVYQQVRKARVWKKVQPPGRY